LNPQQPIGSTPPSNLLIEKGNTLEGLHSGTHPNHISDKNIKEDNDTLRVRARITSPVWMLRHLSDKARGLRILLMERTSHAARRDGSTPKQGKVFLPEP